MNQISKNNNNTSTSSAVSNCCSVSLATAHPMKQHQQQQPPPQAPPAMHSHPQQSGPFKGQRQQTVTTATAAPVTAAPNTAVLNSVHGNGGGRYAALLRYPTPLSLSDSFGGGGGGVSTSQQQYYFQQYQQQHQQKQQDHPNYMQTPNMYIPLPAPVSPLLTSMHLEGEQGGLGSPVATIGGGDGGRLYGGGFDSSSHDDTSSSGPGYYPHPTYAMQQQQQHQPQPQQQPQRQQWQHDAPSQLVVAAAAAAAATAINAEEAAVRRTAVTAVNAEEDEEDFFDSDDDMAHDDALIGCRQGECGALSVSEPGTPDPLYAATVAPATAAAAAATGLVLYHHPSAVQTTLGGRVVMMDSKHTDGNDNGDGSNGNNNPPPQQPQNNAGRPPIMPPRNGGAPNGNDQQAPSGKDAAGGSGGTGGGGPPQGNKDSGAVAVMVGDEDEDEDEEEDPEVVNATVPTSLALRNIGMLAAPAMVSSVLTITSLTITNSFVGRRLGADAFAQYTLGVSVFNMFGTSIGMGLIGALDTLISQAFGRSKQNTPDIGEYLQRAAILCTFLTLPVWVIFCYGEPVFVFVFGEELGAGAARFTEHATPVFLINCFNTILMKTLQAINEPRLPMLSVVVSVAICIVLNYFFTYSFASAIYSLTAAYAAQMITLALLCRFHPRVTFWRQCTWFSADIISIEGFKEFLSIGIPSLASVCAEWWAFEVLNVVSASISPAAVALVNLIITVGTLLFAASSAVSSAASVLVGNSLGSNRPMLAKQYGFTTLACDQCLNLFNVTLLIVFREYIAAAFTTDPVLTNEFTSMIIIVAMYHWGDSTQFCLQGIYWGAGQQKLAARVVLLSLWAVGLPMTVILGRFFGLGGKGIIMGLVCGFIAEVPSLFWAMRNWDWPALALEASAIDEEDEEDEEEEEAGEETDASPVDGEEMQPREGGVAGPATAHAGTAAAGSSAAATTHRHPAPTMLTIVDPATVAAANSSSLSSLNQQRHPTASSNINTHTCVIPMTGNTTPVATALVTAPSHHTGRHPTPRHVNPNTHTPLNPALPMSPGLGPSFHILSTGRPFQTPYRAGRASPVRRPRQHVQYRPRVVPPEGIGRASPQRAPRAVHNASIHGQPQDGHHHASSSHPSHSQRASPATIPLTPMIMSAIHVMPHRPPTAMRTQTPQRVPSTTIPHPGDHPPQSQPSHHNHSGHRSSSPAPHLPQHHNQQQQQRASSPQVTRFATPTAGMGALASLAASAPTASAARTPTTSSIGVSPPSPPSQHLSTRDGTPKPHHE